MVRDDLIARSRVGLLVVVVVCILYVGRLAVARADLALAVAPKGKVRLDLGLHQHHLIATPDCATHSKKYPDARQKPKP